MESIITNSLLILSIVLSVFSATPGDVVNPETSTDEIVRQCIQEVKDFNKNEDKYATSIPNGNGDMTPSVTGPPQVELLERIYSKEKRQRPFECISKKLNVYTETELPPSMEYENLVTKCKSEQENTRCNPTARYRTSDGTCNNLLNPMWGSTLSCIKRLMPAYYEGVSGFRKSVCGGPLPEPRFLSSKFRLTEPRPTRNLTNMFPYFGQILAHDISDLAQTFIGNKTTNCCPRIKVKELHPQCAPIHIPSDDPFYSKYLVTCFNFIRTVPCDSCSVGKRNQMNQDTSYFDASFIYGTADVIVNERRLKDGTGKLTFQDRKAGRLLPPDQVLGLLCGSAIERQYCFKSGDRRIVQHTPLMGLHTVFFREHNRLAEELKKLNPKWEEEQLFQEARRIIIAELQIIIYKEYLPLLIGSDYMKRYDLGILKQGRTLYNASVDSSLTSEFSTGAFRLHSTVNALVTEIPVDGRRKWLRDMYNRASPIYHDYMAMIMEGLAQSPAQVFGKYVTGDLRNFMYRAPGLQGLDIVSINIQRGRDNGLPPYIDMVRFLSQNRTNIKSFDDLSKLMDSQNIAFLKEVYCDVRDIDLWVGMNCERVTGQSSLGKTATEIIARQFADIKFGDRFYVEHQGNFNDKQLKSLKEISLSKVLCDNTKITAFPQNGMLFPSDSNPVILCENIPGVDLKLWKE